MSWSCKKIFLRPDADVQNLSINDKTAQANIIICPVLTSVWKMKKEPESTGGERRGRRRRLGVLRVSGVWCLARWIFLVDTQHRDISGGYFWWTHNTATSLHGLSDLLLHDFTTCWLNADATHKLARTKSYSLSHYLFQLFLVKQKDS